MACSGGSEGQPVGASGGATSVGPGAGSGGSGSGGSGTGGSGTGGKASTSGSGGDVGSASGGAAGPTIDAGANADSPADKPTDDPDSGGGGRGGDTTRDGAPGDATGQAGSGGTGVGGGGGSNANGNPSAIFPPGVTKPRITIVGDSIAAGPGCYKKYLLMNLMANHYSKFEFVGEYTDDCGGVVRHSAVSCSNTDQWSQPMFMMPNCSQGKTFAGMSTVVADVKPDLVMLQLGVNDVWGGGASTDAILANYTKLVNQARARNNRVVVVVAPPHKIAPGASSCNDLTVYNRAMALVNATPAWAKSVSTADSPVFTADLWTNSDQHQTMDCVHPNDAGAQRMGLNWFNALKDILPAN